MRHWMRARKSLIALTFYACLQPSAAPAQSPPAATPASVGMSGERLNRLSSTVQAFVDQGRAAGIVTLVVRQGKVVHFEAFGKRDLESGAAMQKDTIFRIASMSKAVTSVAAMILLEEGKLLLGDPVSKFIPSFKKTTVMIAPPPGAVSGTPVADRAGQAGGHDSRPAHAHRGHRLRRGPGRGDVQGGQRPHVVLRRQGRAHRADNRSTGGAALRRATRRRSTSTASTPTSSASSSRRRRG